MKPMVAMGMLLAVVTLTTPCLADVIVVDINGTGDYTDINTAAAAAQSGDTLLVRLGFYPKFTVGLDKSLNVIGVERAGVLIDGPIGVLNAAPGTRFLIANMTATGKTGTGGPVQGHGFFAMDCQGEIRVQNCTFVGGDGDPDAWSDSYPFQISGHVAGWHGAVVQDCTQTVSFSNCQFEGGESPPMLTVVSGCGCTIGQPGGDGLQIVDSQVNLSGGLLWGGDAGDADNEGGAGGVGVRLVSGVLVASGITATGGDGSHAVDYVSSDGGAGGDGVYATEGSLAHLLDVEVTGGEGGFSFGTGLLAPDGEPVAGDGEIVIHAGSSRSLDATLPAYDDETITLTVSGEPGDLVLLLVSAAPASAGLVPKLHGELLLQSPALTLLIGGVPSGGLLQLSGTIPAVPPGVATTLHLQALAGSATDAALTGPAALVMLDGATY